MSANDTAGEHGSAQPAPVVVRVAPVRVARDPQVSQMVADPAGYFARARNAARSEAHSYVEARVSRPTRRFGVARPA